MKKNFIFKRVLTLVLAVMMLVTAMPVNLLAEPGTTGTQDNKYLDDDYSITYNDKIIRKADYINKVGNLPIEPKKTDNAVEFIKNPDQPAIYTLRADFKVQRGDNEVISYQPYIATVGDKASEEEKKKVDKWVDLPELDGYTAPTPRFHVNYEYIKNNAEKKHGEHPFVYKPHTNTIKVKHVFQHLDNISEYGEPGATKKDIIEEQSGLTGTSLNIQALSESKTPGYKAESNIITTQVPESVIGFEVVFRYNRKKYDVVYDTAGGTSIPSRTVYFEQTMPALAQNEIPEKVGSNFLGWKPSVDLNTKDGRTYKANEIIAVGTGTPITNLAVNLIMPASNVTFTAVWKDKDKAGYAVQFWAEKADHADGASIADKYDYIGTRVYKDQATGSRPDLDNEPVKDIVFPDLDQFRLNKIWKGDKFNRGKDLYLNKFYVYNQDLTHEQNADPANVNLVKSVDATGRTVYNIYYDRQVYELYFTKSNIENSFYPEIWGYDEAQGEVVKKGGPGNPYHYKARFNQLMLGWPNDAMQTKGFDKDMQSFGWGPNYVKPQWPEHLDTPPYRLNADQFLDMEKYDEKGGYVKTIDKGDGTFINVDPLDFKTLSFGIKQAKGSMPHHMDFWMDGFKPGETIIRYDLYRSKADTNSDTYASKYPKVQGFTPYGYKPGGTWPTIVEGNQENGRVDGDGIDKLNAERAAVTPFPAKTYTVFGEELPLGKMKFISAFFNNADEFGDPDGWDGFDTNGYLRFKYTRNKYPLRFNYDPSKIKGDNEFNSTNQLSTFYEFPLKALSPTVDTKDEYKKDKPANLLDNPKNLQTLGLTDLVFTDPKDGKLKVKRPDNLSDQMVFKGWALDPAGTKLIWENPGEKMPSHPVNLYAKWGEPDYQWKVTFDPNGGNLSSIDEAKVTQKRKTIQVGDKGQEETKTFAQKEKNEGDKQVFTVIQRQKLVEPAKPTRKGYDFMGWEFVRYEKDAKGNDTKTVDTSYRDTYHLPELYSFGNDVVSNVHLKAIWVKNDIVDIKAYHHFLDLNFNEEKVVEQTLPNRRAGSYTAAVGSMQGIDYLLVPKDEWGKLEGGNNNYKDYKNLTSALNTAERTNTYTQVLRVEPAEIKNPTTGKYDPNPDAKVNVFHFFYRPFRKREYTVKYVDEIYKGKEEDKGAIIADEEVVNGNRDYDARNFRSIPGWVLTSAPQQQLVFDVGENNEFQGINGTGKKYITFYYKDVRVIEVPKDDPVPDGYVRVTFKADKGGTFKDKDGKEVTELNYDVIKGLKSDLLPVPEELKNGEEKVADKYYITPETGKKFIKWDEKPLLNKNTIVDNNTKDFYVFTAKFEWSGLSATGLVRTEAFKDLNGTWTNDFAPKIEDLKKQLVWMEKGAEKPLPTGTKIQLFDEAGNELTTDDQVYELVNEKKALDKDELVRTVNIKAKVTFKDGKEPQELDIPIVIYKNVYEALNEKGDKPLFLSEAEKKEAKDGGLKDITGNYVKVTVAPTGDLSNKDNKVYYVNKNAWVEIPELKLTDQEKTDLAFTRWSADKAAQNENQEENGTYDFNKRHKFTENTIISPDFSDDVIPANEDGSKPDGTPQNFVKVTVKTTDKATVETAYEKIFWVNPAKEVRLPVNKPTGKDVAVSNDNPKAFTWVFTKWTSDESPSRAWGEDIDTGIRAKFDKETIITANYDKSIHEQGTVVAEEIEAYESTKGINDFIPTEDALKAQVKVIDANGTAVALPSDAKLELVLDTAYADLDAELYDKLKEKDNANDEPTRIEKVKAKVTFANGEVQDVEIPIKVIKNIYEAKTLAEKPYYVPTDYVRVVLNPTSSATDPQKTYYYVNPKAKVVIPGTNPTGVGDSKFIKWTMKADSTSGMGTDYTLSERHQFTEASTITAQYSADVVPQEGTTKPEGVPDNFVEVKFVPTNKAQDTTEKIYWVNPAVEVTIPVENPKGTQYYTFKEWKIGDVTTGETYTVGTPRKFTQASTVITATYEESKNVIPYNPSAIDPMARPDGYVRVSFAADDGLKLTNVKHYYVKKNSGITLGNAELVKPAYEAQTGYEFTNWDKEDTLVIADQDVLVTAKAKVLPDFDTTNHTGYVKVTFKADANGVIKENGNKIDEKVYYVNPNKYVNLKAPTPVADTGYEFSTWSKPGDDNFSLANFVKYEEDTTITAKFNLVNTVIPIVDGVTKQPKNFVKVTFKFDANSEGHGALIGTTEYYVDSTQKVVLNPPAVEEKIGYKFKKWSQDAKTPTQYTQDTIIECTLDKLDDIIKAKEDDTDDEIPQGYVLIYFYAGPKGTAKGQAMYYVNPDANKTIGNLTKPAVTANTGYEFIKWDTVDSTVIKNDQVIYAEYNELEDKILVEPGVEKPAGYVKVTFAAGDHGTVDTMSYYVNPNKYVKLDPPETHPEPNFEFSLWDPDVINYTKYEKDTTITAKFRAQKLVTPNVNGIAQPANTIKVTFKIKDTDNSKGSLDGVREYYVVKNTEVTINPPMTLANVGFEFEKWDKDTTKPTVYTEDTVVVASFNGFDPILPATDGSGATIARPNGYVVVHFLNGEHGRLSGETIFYVNPKAGKTLKDILPKPSVIEDTGYVFDKWDKDENTSIQGPNDLEVTALYKERADIITAGPTQTAPKGYVVIIFKTDGNGTMTSRITDEYGATAKNVNEIVYFVNPNKNIKLTKGAAGPNLLPVPDTNPNDNYVFDEWFNDIDSVNPIIRGRVHVAKFKPAKVKLTYEANGAEGNPPAELEVNYNTNVRLAGQGNLKKKDAKFLGWKIGNDINLKQAGDEIILTKDTLAVAQWEDEDNIIKYNPEEPITRPVGYVRVMFNSDDGLSLSNVNYYYVKADKGLTLADIRNKAEYGYPNTNPKTGYKFDNWDKDDTLEINTDIKVEALSTPLADTIVKVDENTEKPSNYVEVKFIAGANGTVEEKTYFVNPNKYVTLTPPTAKGDTGYEFGSWSQDATIPTVYTKDPTIIRANFNGLKNLIPKTSPDGTENTQPDGYKTVTFVIDPATGGKIKDGEVTVYYVNPAKDVTVPQPKTLADIGYEFEKWDTDTTVDKMYTEDITVKGNFKKLEDIIPSTDKKGNPNAKPEGYVTVTFEKGEHGTKIEGQTVYYVNPKAGVILGDAAIIKPTVTAETGWKQRLAGDPETPVWKPADTLEIKKDTTVSPYYDSIADVVPKIKSDGTENKQPDGYITVTFEKGANGELEGNTTFYINPNKAVVLEDKAPIIKPNTGYTSAAWDTSINKAIQYKDGDKITALYNELGDVIPQENPDGSDKPAGYLTVTFDKGTNGELSGKTVYYVKPNKEVTVPAPKVTPNVGYEFKEWDKALTQTFTEDTTITAGYKALDDIIPQKKTDGSDKPDGYFTVRFKAVNGNLEGTTVYYVKPNVDIDLTNTADAITKKANVGYTAEGGTWNPVIVSKIYTADAEYEFNFKALDDVIPKVNPQGGENKIPVGYVTVKLIPTDKSTDKTEKVYYVNPLKENVTISGTDPVGKEFTDAIGNTYTFLFKEWTVTRGTITPSWEKGKQIIGTFTQDTDITAKYNIKAEKLINGPIPKDNVVTAKGDTPKPEDLIKNIPGSENDPLPKGTTFKYTDDGTPDLSEPGKTTAKVEVTYPNGKTVVVEVPITVVDNVVPQIGGLEGNKPLVPDSYVKVIVDTTSNATENTRFVKVFWVKPGVEVTLPDILAPTGRTVTDLTTRVTKTNNFIKWKLVGSDPEKFYETDIRDTFTAKESRIIAVYEFNKNIEPQAKDDQWIPQKSTPDPKDFIKNPYNDGDPNNKNNLPPGTKFEFVPGAEPDTSNPGENKQTKIKVTYPNGEVKEVPVTYNVSGDVVEQTDPNKKPDVPENFVRVIVNTTDLATNVYEKTYWVNPDKRVEIPAPTPDGIEDEEDHRKWLFDYWQEAPNGRDFGKTIEGIFDKETTYIEAHYYKDIPRPDADYVVTDVGILPRERDYLEVIKEIKGKTIDHVRIIKDPDVSKPGRTHAEVDVYYTDGTWSSMSVDVFVQRPNIRPYPEIIYRDKIVEKEKIVEIRDNERLKEIRFMQGFNGKFRPYDTLTRAEAATILANALREDGYVYDTTLPLPYADVGDMWYTESIKVVTQANVFQGYGDGLFKPEGKITRAEWVATLRRFQNLVNESGNTMGLRSDHWAIPEVEAAYKAGWLAIYQSGIAQFDADMPITRQEVAAVTNKAFNRLNDKIYIVRNAKGLVNYKDINPNMPLYEDILCASNTFLSDGKRYKGHGVLSGLIRFDHETIFNIEIDDLIITQKKFQYNVIR